MMGHLPVLLCFLPLLTLTSLSTAQSCKRFGLNCYACNETQCTICDDGYCGSNCTRNCTGYCSSACHKPNCSCKECLDGYYGDNCSSACSGRCYKTPESPSVLCHRNGTCTEGCKYGFCSPNTTCSTRCSNCIDDDCDSYTCKCRKGVETPKDPSADCGKCRNQTCKRGVCIGCEDGYHGEHCEKQCTDCDICYQLDGKCIPCNSLSNVQSCKERFGDNCYACKEECTECNASYCGLVCAENCTGSCKYGCHKLNCSCIACADGYRGDNCSSPCSRRCYKVAESPSPLCQRNGTCSDGCKYGFCLPNTNCSTRCRNCVDDDCDPYTCKCRQFVETPKVAPADCEKCRDQTCKRGVCIGCEEGYHGEHCDKSCPSCDICHQNDGKCIPQNKRFLAWCWSYAGLATLACIVFGVLFLWYYLKHRHRYDIPRPH
ncbi:multiple epidermal growth factor-like domains protein 10 isoform X1 [Haliotis asinina]|uniref:multiple epidermal growth factor-like domains protein 10 isoform X1 n=1 Tax=Haliotis asinina TaxID=109174 RepID=UPI003531A3EE